MSDADESSPAQTGGGHGADAISYPRLIGEKETGTHEALRRFHVEKSGPTVPGYLVNAVRSIGEGWLAEFSNAVQTVDCALATQDRLADDPLIRLYTAIRVADVAIDAAEVLVTPSTWHHGWSISPNREWLRYPIRPMAVWMAQ